MVHSFATLASFMFLLVSSNLPLSGALFGWLRGRKKTPQYQESAVSVKDALDAEYAAESVVAHSYKRGPDGCAWRLKTALDVVKTYGASFKPKWHWPWSKKKKKNDFEIQREMRENLEMIDHCVAIAEHEEQQRGNFVRRRRRWAYHNSELDDKSALKSLTGMVRSKNIGDHWKNLQVIRWGRRAIHDLSPAIQIRHSAEDNYWRHKIRKNRRKIRPKKFGRRWKRKDDGEEEEGEESDDEGSDEDEGDESAGDKRGKGYRFKFTKKAHGYSRDKGREKDKNKSDHIVETVSFEAEHPRKGRYTTRITKEHKFSGAKNSEWRDRPPKTPKAEGRRAWTGKFKENSLRDGTAAGWGDTENKRYRKYRRGRDGRRRGDYYSSAYSMFDPLLTGSYSYGGYIYGYYPSWHSSSADGGEYEREYYGYERGFGDASRRKKQSRWSTALKILGIVLLVLFIIIII